jgi:chemosensory pili system protein ChpA (sensor histidine kinase/response regulator)
VTPESNGAIAEVTERPDVPVLTEVVELAPVAEEVQEFAEVADSVSAPESVTETPPESSGEVEVGSVSLPTQIYNAFVNDGRSFQDSLQASIQDAITGKRKSVDFEVMRMAHSLAGMGRTTGLNAVTHLAERVEAWVSINQDRDLHLTDDAKAVLSDAMEALDAMIMGVTDKIEPEMELSIVARLQAIITADEHRIAMAVDTRPDVTDLVLEQLNDGDVMVTDEGVTPTSSSMLIQASLEQHAEAGAADMEVAKVPVPFRHSEESITDPIAAIVETGDTVDIVEESSAFQAPAQAAEEVSHGASEPVVQGFDGRVLTPEVAEVVIDFELPKDSIELVNASGQVSRASLVIDEPQQVVESQQVEFDLQAASEWTEDPTTASQQEYLSIDWLAVVDTRMDDVDPEMFDIFLEEADERFEEIDATLNALGTAISDKKLTNLLKRAVHTLKGSANTAGCRKLGAIFHHLEDMMEATPVLNFPMLTVLQSGVDAAFGAMTAMRKGKSVEDAIKKVIKSVKAAGQGGALDAAEIVESSQVHAAKEGAELDADGITESNASTVSIAPSTVQITAENTQTKTSAGDSSVPAAKDRAEKKFVKSNEEDDSNLRVSTRTLDKMVKSVGEINISRSRVSMNVDITKMSLTGLASSLELMYGYLRQVEMEAERQMSAGDLEKGRDTAFDALQMDRFTRLQELTRRVAEAQSDVMAQQGSAVGAVRDMEEALANQNVLVNEISSDLDQIRQVRVSSVVPVLKRVVRAACRDTEKMGEIFFDADVEIDRGILSKVMGSLEHILRNAVAHGLEKPEERLALGKEEAGTIEFRAYQDGGEVVIEVHDDGRGMDTQRIFDSAVKKGVIKAGAKLSESQIRELIFEPGFSTASEVTDIAGRGVGLDVVRSDISAMGGRVTVNSKLGAGSTFILRVPATLTVISGTAVLTNNHMYVIPVSFIDRLVRINGEELDKAYASQKLLVQDNAGNQVEYEFWGMWQIAGAKVWDNNKSWRNSVLLMSNDRVAVHIDEIRPATEFVFRPLGPQVANSNGLIGSTIASNGNASLVIDPSRVARTLRSISAGKITGIADQKKAPLILVVDDSTTVRKVTARMLKREGYRHLEAENGMKALEMLQGELPDVILMDIEMPVMNGYDASQAIRATPQTSSIPIIMITSRAGESHRRRAMEIGVNEYLGKPYNENDLIGLIRKFTGEDKRSRVVNG